MTRPAQSFRSRVASELRSFIEAKRALGRRYTTDEKQLRLFDAFLAQHTITTLAEVTPQLVDAFIASRPRCRPRSYNALVGVIARFFDWLVRQGRIAKSPVKLRPRRETARRIPFLFGPDDVRRLLDVVALLPDNPRAPLRAVTYKTIFALLYGLGLRVGEVSRLKFGDVDLVRRLLVIRETKFGKSRLVPFGPHIEGMLRSYIALRGACLPDAAVFAFTSRGAIHPGTISQTFHHLVPRLGLVIPPGVAPPRVHDLRHAFAVGTLLRWYREGIDPAARLFHLSTFLGHVNPSSTAVYLTITPELLNAANHRFKAFAASVLGQVSR